MFSVVIPVFNKGHTLARTLRTALGQTLGAFEIILVDDGSTDGGLDCVADVDDSRIRRLSQIHSGPGPARNAAIAAARNEWVALLDADDLWAPDHLEELDRIRSRHPEASLIGTASAIAMLDRAEAVLLGLGGARSGRIEAIDLIAAFGRAERPLFTSSAALRKAAWAQTGGFTDDETGQDRELFVRLALAGEVAVSDRPTAVAVYGTGGISDHRASRPRARPPERLQDLAPSVRTLLEARPLADPERRRSIDLYVRCYLHWTVQEAARAHDVATLRALLALDAPSARGRDRLPLAVARLPEAAARRVLRMLYPRRG